ncbi:hypothetical protein GCM10008090_25740 [Arenicella chitinivorans]|uniref:WD40 repeat protein n=1 Tax=Arenicella chitinivorans TaxID=1329800 RepID=A0A918RXN4_9GAMM|nr:PD40 domain-containing protein [Arenicella chitinivorans]GHA15037.1 hypothetical protein GCM10008090_25740 [Arenicella chitinivorans]
MKQICGLISLLFLSAISNKSIGQNDSLVIKGSYLGQQPPGLNAEVFAPGIVSTKHRDFSGFFSPDMQEFYFTRRDNETEEWTLIVYKNENSQWSESTVGPRVGRPILSPDGNTMHLGKYYMERTETGWTDVKSLGPMFDGEDWGIMRLSASENGTYVLDDYKGDGIRISTLENGERLPPRKMSPAINTGKNSAHPFISPDESYLIWDTEREDGHGDSDLYISFRKKDGSWGEAINMGDKVNTESWEAGGYVTPDGKYLFFNRHHDMYWVNAKFIEDLRPKLD